MKQFLQDLTATFLTGIGIGLGVGVVLGALVLIYGPLLVR